MKRSVALVMLIVLMVACVAALTVFIARTPGDNPVLSYFASADEAYSFAGAALTGGDAFGQDEQPTNAPAALTPVPTDTPAATDVPAATAEPAATDAMSATAAPAATDAAEAASAAPVVTPAPTAVVRLPAAAVAPAAVNAADSFGTPVEYSDDKPKFDYSVLAAQTGLDPDVLAKMYTPFYVLDIGMDEVYYPLTSPGGGKGSNKIYGGQVGINVVSIEGDYAYINAYRYPGGRAIKGYVPTRLLKEVTPDDQYSIIVDKREQKLFLFEYGQLKAEMYCSTGKTTTETPAGEFIKYGSKGTIYSDADPDIAYDGIRINGRVYIHSVSHIGGDYSKSISMLGRKASHGCIRVPLDWAEWFYENIPNGTKVIITEYRGDTPPLGTGGRDGD